MKKNQVLRKFIVHKVVYARSVREAILYERNTDVISVQLDPDWEESVEKKVQEEPIGFINKRNKK